MLIADILTLSRKIAFNAKISALIIPAHILLSSLGLDTFIHQ